MYQPPHHREDRLDIQHALIEAHPFGLLISTGPDGLLANGLPFTLKRGQGSFGVLKAHIARANNQWQTLDGQQVLVVFQGPLMSTKRTLMSLGCGDSPMVALHLEAG